MSAGTDAAREWAQTTAGWVHSPCGTVQGRGQTAPAYCRECRRRERLQSLEQTRRRLQGGRRR